MVKLFVGNVADKVTNDDLRGLFEPFGVVSQADILQGRGYGFVVCLNRICFNRIIILKTLAYG